MSNIAVSFYHNCVQKYIVWREPLSLRYDRLVNLYLLLKIVKYSNIFLSQYCVPKYQVWRGLKVPIFCRWRWDLKSQWKNDADWMLLTSITDKELIFRWNFFSELRAGPRYSRSGYSRIVIWYQDFSLDYPRIFGEKYRTIWYSTRFY